MDNKENEKNINNDDEKSELDKEIEAELIEYMNSDKKEEKEEKKKYKTAGFIVALVIAILYMVKFAKHFMYIDLHSLMH
ncbi:hypothetical protein ACO2FM_05600 [Staphylococcus pasteuri]|uniref:hypothetical protein n=1 Tax=Staphylococcus pasteuri TaxID=45972 RepID=UPI000F835B23|nr:hypothetical protein [Staphylococcus pasteuri]MEB6612343.1 hypothetical protein [Staphylococcus pasteuri]QDW85368.1 hypothetical protein DWB95_10710 [Staphylococcus pasteuri]QQN53860.1 hypothetical protein I6I26_10895 [Staphylococcus pasteuri]RTX72779.1 hypothetical protein CD121_07585 [Staphylococcus pasteuri]